MVFVGDKRVCVFLNLRIKNDIVWLIDGCNVVFLYINRIIISCVCDYMIVFGILMEINDYKVIFDFNL